MTQAKNRKARRAEAGRPSKSKHAKDGRTPKDTHASAGRSLEGKRGETSRSLKRADSGRTAGSKASASSAKRSAKRVADSKHTGAGRVAKPHALAADSNRGANSKRAVKANTPTGDSRLTTCQACGSCSLIDVPYADQLAGKQAQVEELLRPFAKDCIFEPIAGMEDPWCYRDKIASPFAPGKYRAATGGARGAQSDKRHGARGKSSVAAAGQRAAGKGQQRDIRCGMYAPGTHRIVEIDSCPVENPAGRKVVAAVRRLMFRYDMAPYDEDAQTGFVRYVVIRVGHESGEVLVTLVTNGSAFPGSKNFCRELVKACPEVTSVVQNVNTRQTNAILGDEEHVLYGPGFILDTLCGLSFRVSSHSFYQVNARQTETLYRIAIDMAARALREGNSPQSVPGTQSEGFALLDAYCGTGTIGLVAASCIENVHVMGVDTVASAIADARLNARHNHIENAEFTCADAGAYLKGLAQGGGSLDVLMMDPPRAGASEEFLEAALALRPAHIVYISCNPATQARDIATLVEGGYTLRVCRAVDMFPHTPHIENVVLLSRT